MELFPFQRNPFRWRGRDDNRTRVSSGVYLVRHAIDGLEQSQKIVMIE